MHNLVSSIYEHDKLSKAVLRQPFNINIRTHYHRFRHTVNNDLKLQRNIIIDQGWFKRIKITSCSGK